MSGPSSPLPAPFLGAFAGRRVLVTGATGFKGSWLCRWLLDLGAEVCGLSIDVPTQPSHFVLLGLADAIRDVRADVRDPAAVRNTLASFQPEFVFHLAAQALVRASYRDPVTTFATNVLGSVHVLDAIRHHACVRAAVMVTSDKCYENVEQTAPYREDDRLGGQDPYSASKAAAEIAFSAYVRSFFGAPGRHDSTATPPLATGPLLASARAGNVIGGGDWAADRIVPDCVRAWLEGVRPVIRSPRATRPWQHVLEPLSGYLWLAVQLARHETRHHGASYNFGPGPQTDEPVIRLIETLRRSWPDAPAPEIREPAGAMPEAGLLRLDCSLAARALPWRATLDFDETARFTAEWYRGFQQEPAGAARRTLQQIAEYTALARARGLAWASP